MTMYNATSRSLKVRKIKREDRLIKILGYLKIKPGQTVYSLHKHFNWPIGSTHSLITELEEEEHIKFQTIEENNRLKKVYTLMTLEDYIKDYFSSKTLLIPINIRAAKNALSKGYSIQVEMDNGSIETIQPNMSIEEFIEENQIRLNKEKIMF